MHWAYIGTISVYLVLLVVIGLRGSRDVSTQEDFAVAGRKLDTFVLFGSLLATWIGTGSIFGNAEKTYQVGLAALLLPVGCLIGIALLSFLAGRARNLKQITIQDLLEKRYNATARVCGAVALIVAYTTIVSYQYRAAGAVLNLALPSLSLDASVLVCTAFIIVYTALAGMVSVAWVGLVMGVTMIVGVLVTLPAFYWKIGGLAGAAQVLPASHFQVFGPIGWVEAIGLTLPSCLLVLGDANMYQRFFSARSAGIARRSVLWMLGGVAFMEVGIILMAFFGSALAPGLETPGRVIAYAARDHLPVPVGALMLTTILAIILSTATSYLLAPATAVVRDLYQRFWNPFAEEARLLAVVRVVVVVLGVAAYGLSRLSNQFLSVALLAYTIYGASITPALMASFLWRRATGQGAVASIAAGTLVTLGWWMWGPAAVDPVLPAAVASTLALVLVSLATPPPRLECVEPFFVELEAQETIG